MAKKSIGFSINQLVINGAEFDEQSFSLVSDSYSEPLTVTNDGTEEILKIQKAHKNFVDERFVTLYFSEGNKFPYTDKVVIASDPTHPEEDNPRAPDQIELDSQLFVLADIQTQRIYISDQRKKKSLIGWLADKTGDNIYIKGIINENEFVEKLETVDKIIFSIEPTLLNSGNEDTLTNNLAKDIHGYGADKAKIELSYNKTKINDMLLGRIKGLIGKKEEFENVVVIGHTDEEFESIFNAKEIVSKISVSIDVPDNSRLMEEETVFDLLIHNIKENE